KRRLALARCARAVIEEGLPVWVGGGSVATTELAVDLGPTAAVNLWGGQPSAVAALAARGEVTWGGPVSAAAPQMAMELSELADAGATWAVCAWPESLETVADVAALLRGN
ncbi:MAG: hypothetical protein ACRDY1_16600, partial [Acidimicrobiales bacterium]